MQARNSSNTPQHAANSLQNSTAATRAAPLTRAHTHQCCGGDATRAVHHEGTQPRAEQGIQACCSHGAGQEAPGRVVTAVSPTSGHGRRHWGDTGAHGHMRTRHGQKAASVAVASHLPEVALAPATTAAAGSLTVSAPPLTVA